MISRRRQLKHDREFATSPACHGLGWLLPEPGPDRRAPFQRGWLRMTQRAESYTQPEPYRMAFEGLGVVFIRWRDVRPAQL